MAEWPQNHRPGEFESGQHAKEVMAGQETMDNQSPDGGMFGAATPSRQEMDDDELMAVIREFEQESYGYASGQLAQSRAYAIERYLALPYGDEVDGRSGVVDTGLRDTIEWLMPQVLRVFLAGDQIVKLDPKGPEDEAAAKQETDYVNHVILERNDAFNVFSTWFRDALMTKVGYVKAYWHETHDIISETYRGLTDDQLMMLHGDQAVEVASLQSYPDQMQSQPGVAPVVPPGQMPMMPPQAMLHDVKVRRLKTQGYVKVDNVPAEEIRVHRSQRTISIADALFIRHAARRTLSQLRQDGYDIPDDIASSGSADEASNVLDQIAISRDRFADDSDLREDLQYVDPSARRVWLNEDYVRVDFDGDGIAELRKVCHIAGKILSNEELDIIPMAAITPIVFPHRHVGIGYDDLCDMPSKVATALQRGYLDNMYLQNNGRYGVDVTKVNIDDMLVSRPGGLVRVQGQPSAAIFPFQHPPVTQAMEGMQWARAWREMSTGVSPDQSNLSADALNNVAPGTVAQSVAAGQVRIESVARSFATGVKELFGIVHALTLKNTTHDEKVKLNNNWVTVDPREWVKRTNMTITVGLGTGTRETRLAHLTQLAQMQAQAMQIGVANPQNIYHTGALITQEMGYKNADEFWADPSKQPPKGPPPPPPQVMVEQMRQQGEGQARQQQAQIEQQRMMLEDQSKQRSLAAEQAVQQSNDQRDAARTQIEYQLKREQMMMQAQMDDVRHQREQDTAIQIANINASSKLEVARIGAGVDDGSQLLQQEEKQAGYQMSTLLQSLQEALTAPKQIVRDASGRAVGLQTVKPTVQ